MVSLAVGLAGSGGCELGSAGSTGPDAGTLAGQPFKIEIEVILVTLTVEVSTAGPEESATLGAFVDLFETTLTVRFEPSLASSDLFTSTSGARTLTPEGSLKAGILGCVEWGAEFETRPHPRIRSCG